MQVQLVLLALLVLSCWCIEDESHKLNSKSKNLDSSLRIALLRALTELENENDSRNSRLNSNTLIEKASASAISIYHNDNIDNSIGTSTTPSQEDNKQIVVVQKSNGLQHKPITTFIPSNISDKLITSASSNLNSTPKRQITSQTAIPTTERIHNLASPSPTAETPTTEETEIKVKDVQFFSAPLVAAFTVHQDERGLPKSIEPIYKQSTDIPRVTNFLDKYVSEKQSKPEELQAHIALQGKQKFLEEQLYKLQRQQKEHQEFLYRQQRLIQEQHKLLTEKENRIPENGKPFGSILRNSNTSQNLIQNHNNFIGQNSNKFISTSSTAYNQIESVDPIGSTVVLQPSISLSPTDSFNIQHLHHKKFNNLRQIPHVHESLDQVQPVLVPPNQYPYDNINYQGAVDVSQPENVRIYRQEPPLASFYNNNYNSYIRPVTYRIQPSVSTNMRYLRSNGEHYQTTAGLPLQAPIVNQQLSNLLYNSGINTGRSEDLDLISKVLSYNHVDLRNARHYTAIHRSDK